MRGTFMSSLEGLSSDLCFFFSDTELDANLSLTLETWGILGNLLNLSVPQFSLLLKKNGANTEYTDG